MKILINGAEGQLASEFKILVNSFPQFDIKFYDKNLWDIQDNNKNEQIIIKENADVLLNLAAYTRVDMAEEEAELCFDINAHKPEFLAQLCKAQQTKFIYLSSDYVFFNKEHKPILPESIKNPKGVYSCSKSLGEDLVLQANPQSLILRTSWLYSSFGNNFVKTMIRLGREKKYLNIVDDQYGSPCYARDLAEALMTMMNYIDNPFYKNYSGYYHYSNTGTTNWLGFAREIFNYIDIKLELNGISSEEYGAAAPRPPYSVLDLSKTITDFHLSIHSWQDSLHRCLDDIKINQLH